MSYPYKKYAKSDVKNQYPGYTNKGWLAPVSAFTILQEPASGVNPAPGDSVIITQAHTFPEQEGFVQIHFAPNSVEAPASWVGPIGAKRAKWQPKVLIPGDTPYLQELVQQLANEDVVLILPDSNCPGGQLMQFGCSCTPANVSDAKFSSGNTGDESGQKAFELTFDSYCRYFYNATIVEKP